MTKTIIYRKLLQSKWRLMILFLLGGTLPVLFLGMLATTTISQSLEKQILKDNHTTANIASTLIEQHLQNAKEILHTIANDKEVIQIIEKSRFDKFAGILEKFHIRFHDFQYLSIYTTEGALRGIYPPNSSVLQENVFFQDWYKGVSSQWEPYISNVYRAEVIPFPYVVAIVIPIYNSERQVIGMVMAPFNVGTIRDWVKSLVIGSEGFLFVVDRQGTTIVHPQLDPAKQPRNLISDPSVAKVVKQKEGAEKIAYLGERYFTAYTFIPSLGWGVIVRQPRDRAMLPVYRASIIIAIGAIFLLIINSAVGLALGRIYKTNIELRQTIEIKNEALKRANGHLSRQNEELEIFNSINAAMNQSLDIEKIFHQTLNELLSFSGAEVGLISLLDENSKKLKLLASHGVPGDFVQHYEETSLEQSYAGLTLKTLQTVEIKQNGVSPLFDEAVENQLYLKSFICFPIIQKGVPVGAITLGGKQTHNNHFNKEMLKTISSQMATASENARLYQKIEQQNEQIKKASENKSEFVRNLSHQLRTPLNAINGFAQILQYDGKLDKMDTGYVENIIKNGKLLLRLIEDIVDLAKIEAGILELSPETVKVAKLLKDVRVLVSPLAAPKKLKLIFKFDKSLTLTTDNTRIKQILYNLLNNAVNYSEKNSMIELKIQEKTELILFSIKDGGPCIAPEDLEQVFKEFQKTDDHKRLYKGTGIAMALSKKYIEQFQGKIWIENINTNQQKGVIIHFTLPKNHFERLQD